MVGAESKDCVKVTGWPMIVGLKPWKASLDKKQTNKTLTLSHLTVYHICVHNLIY